LLQTPRQERKRADIPNAIAWLLNVGFATDTARRERCNYPDYSRTAAKGGVCQRYGAEKKIELTNGACHSHNVCTKTKHSLPEQEHKDSPNQLNFVYIKLS